MSAKDRDLEISDDLARGKLGTFSPDCSLWVTDSLCSAETFERIEVEDFFAVQEEFRVRKGCTIP